MTEKPKLDYFVFNGKVINRGDEGFDELEAKYVKEVEVGVKETEKSKKTDTQVRKGGTK